MRARMVGGAVIAVTAAVAALAGPVAANAAPNTEKAIPHSAPGWLSHGTQTGTAAASAAVQARVYLAPRGGMAALSAVANAVSTPGSSSYHRFLTPAQVHAQFDASAATVDAVRAWLAGAGLTVSAVDTAGQYVDITGTVAGATKAFGTAIANYSHDGQSVQAPTGDLHAPASVADQVLAVSGLDTSASTIAPGTQKPSPASPGFRNPQVCSAPDFGALDQTAQMPDGTVLPTFQNSTAPLPLSPCGYTGPQLRNAYEGNLASTSNGAGVTVAIVDAFASPTVESDANRYATTLHDPAFDDRNGQFSQSLPNAFNQVNTGKRQCDASGWYGEETLDVEAVHAMAPAANVRYYAASTCNDRGFLDAFARINSEGVASVVSNSWGGTGDAVDGDLQLAYETAFLRGAAVGISYVFSSGDAGDDATVLGTPQTDYPASDPYVTAVGGTSTEIKGGAITAETGWQTEKWTLEKGVWTQTAKFQSGGGGGYSTHIPEPQYQIDAGIKSPNNGRAVPDVSMLADPNTGMLVGQTQAFPEGVSYDTYRIGGTSVAAPLFAGATAIKVQNSGMPNNVRVGLGLLNPLIYADHSGFADVTGAGMAAAEVRVDYVDGTDAKSGYVYSVRIFDTNNQSLRVHTGWDDETGWGSVRAGWLMK
ncbi:S53 family peptidase [Microbacterium sp. ASV49]|uniref:S53 family peptidase n=1 Tax=Microbacterium candidum TaxID=3041922 RepID=A0ABT7MZ01_9MICO|nr:S53 family peptidase [Microbacterium sp. ASV49]MDL9979676.1 S53 family peptidase [Microbacterium sp. ASV49]